MCVTLVNGAKPLRRAASSRQLKRVVSTERTRLSNRRFTDPPRLLAFVSQDLFDVHPQVPAADAAGKQAPCLDLAHNELVLAF